MLVASLINRPVMLGILLHVCLLWTQLCELHSVRVFLKVTKFKFDILKVSRRAVLIARLLLLRCISALRFLGRVRFALCVTLSILLNDRFYLMGLELEVFALLETIQERHQGINLAFFFTGVLKDQTLNITQLIWLTIYLLLRLAFWLLSLGSSGRLILDLANSVQLELEAFQVKDKVVGNFVIDEPQIEQLDIEPVAPLADSQDGVTSNLFLFCQLHKVFVDAAHYLGEGSE